MHRSLTLGVLGGLLLTPRAVAQQDMVTKWNRPFEPFRIIGNVHYVGTSELGVYLITSKEGHALIDGGFAETAPLILDSIRALGFEPQDVKVLLTTQAHMDHVGSMAALKAATGAQTMVMEPDVEVMERGGKGTSRSATRSRSRRSPWIGRSKTATWSGSRTPL
jgi:metallo-beta-lactamase class B